MIHDIEPRIFHNVYEDRAALPEDLFLAYRGDTVLVNEGKDKLWYPSFADFPDVPDLMTDAQFLFTIDELSYFLVDGGRLEERPGWVFADTARFRSERKYWRSFAGAVGLQLNRWYDDHRYCSRCSKPLKRSARERMLYCPGDGFKVYPTINPCIIVGVYDGDKLLLTKYAGREQRNFALIGGFNEVGESIEQTVHREVMEEVGLKVKNLQYYKSQPWPFSNTLLFGFFAEVDGDTTIRLDYDELSIGVWLQREEIPAPDSDISLTAEMINLFRRGGR